MASWQMRAVYGMKEEVHNLESSFSGNKFTCAMCKKLVPYLKTHECKSKCSSLWPFLQGTCEYLCAKLIQYAPTAACWEARYCPKPVIDSE